MMETDGKVMGRDVKVMDVMGINEGVIRIDGEGWELM